MITPVVAIVSIRWSAPHDAGHCDFDLLIAVRDFGNRRAAEDVRDQCAPRIFAQRRDHCTSAVLGLISADAGSQREARLEPRRQRFRLRALLDDLGHWPRLRLVLLEDIPPHPGDGCTAQPGAESPLSVVLTISLRGIISVRWSLALGRSMVASPGCRCGIPTLGALMTGRFQGPGRPSSSVGL
jgi:hypothetical protein